MVNIDIEITNLKKYADQRGFLVEFLKGIELKEKKFAQIYLTTFEPGTIRGDHYHSTKDEYFTIMTGKIKIILEDINTKERKEIIIDADEKELKRLRIGKNIAHTIKNISNSVATLVAYTTKEYDPENLDQKRYILEK